MIIGIFFIINYNKTFKIAFNLMGYAIIISVILKIIDIILKKKKRTVKIFDIIINIIIGISLVFFPKIFILLSSQIFGIYALLQSLCDFINVYIYDQDKLKGKIFIFFIGIIKFIFALLLLFSPIKNSIYISILIGIYLIFCGLVSIINIVIAIKMPLPLIFTAFLPKILINKVKKENKINNEKDLEHNFEILIHLAPSGTAAMGHVEVSFENKIYSYGCYNYLSTKLFGGMGDGIIGIFDHDAYIKYCVTEKDRFIVSYGLKLNEKEKNKVRNAIDKLINTDTVRWYPEEALYDNNLIEKKKFNQMSNQIYHKANGIFYKFTKGKYKTFFVLRTNCVAGADKIISSFSNKLLKIEGILTPGTYYKYLDNEYLRKDSKIISKTLYTKEVVEKKKYKYKKKKIEIIK